MKPTTTLTAFLKHRFRFTGHDRRKRAATNYVTAFNRFGAHLKRVAVLSDLNAETWGQFVTWLDAQPTWSEKSKQATRNRIRGTWRKAHELGLAPALPAKASKLRRDLWEAADVPDRSLSAFFEGYYRTVKLRSRARNTVRLYRFTVRNFCRYLGRHATLDDLNDDTVSGMLATMTEQGKSPYTAEKERSQLLAIWRAACRKGLLTIWPDVQAEKLPIRTPRAWMVDDLHALWKAIEATPGTISGIPANRWFAALHYVLLYSAERIGAVMALRWSDYDPATGWITFAAESRKGGRADSSARLPPDAIEALEGIREPVRDLIFPWDQAPTYIYRKYATILRAAGLPVDAKSKFHRVRKTAASHYEAAGGNATNLLRHSSRKTTLAYLDPRVVIPPQAADLLGGLLTGGAP